MTLPSCNLGARTGPLLDEQNISVVFLTAVPTALKHDSQDTSTPHISDLKVYPSELHAGTVSEYSIATS